MANKIVLNKRFILTSNAFVLVLSLIISYVFDIDVRWGHITYWYLLGSILLGLVFAISFKILSLYFKVWNKTSLWVFQKNSYSSFWNFLFFPFIVAFGQEIFFRGVLIPLVGILFGSVFFAFYNVQFSTKKIPIIFADFMKSVILSLVYFSTGNIIYSILIHASFFIFGRILFSSR